MMDPNMQHQPPPHFQQAEARPNISQSRSGLPNQTAPSQKGSQNAYATYDPRFAQWNFSKGKKSSWAEVRPQQQHVSMQSLQDDMERLRKEGASVKQAMREIPSDNARGLISELVEAQDRVLMNLNPKLRWTIAAIELEFRDLNRRLRQLKSIDVFLRTEPRILAQANAAGGRVKTSNAGDAHEQRGNDRTPNMNNVPQGQHMHQHAPNTGHAHGPNVRNEPHYGLHDGQNEQFNSYLQRRDQGHGNEEHLNQIRSKDSGYVDGQGHNQQQQQNHHPQNHHPQTHHPQNHHPQNHHPQNHHPQDHHPQNHAHIEEFIPPPPPPPPPPPNAGQHGGKQGMGIPPPPRPPLDHEGGQNPGISASLPRPAPYPSMRHEPPRFPSSIEVMDPHILKLQKKKPISLPGEFPEETKFEAGSDPYEHTSGSETFSAESIEGGAYNVVRSRSRNIDSKKIKRSRQTRSRSRSRGRVPKWHKEKASHRRSNSVLERPPMGPNSGTSSHENSPKPSAATVQPQQIHIHMPPNIRERDDDRRDSDRERDRYRDRSFEPERQRDFRDRIRRQYSHKRSPSASPRSSYDKIGRESPRSMSHGSSSEVYSDAVYTDETASVYSIADDSVFSEPIYTRKSNRTRSDVNARKPLMSRAALRRQTGDMIQQETSDVDPRAVPHQSVEGFGNSHYQSSRHRHSHPVVHNSGMMHDSWHDNQDAVTSWQHQAHRPYMAAHRDSMQVPYASEHSRYTPTLSTSHAAEPTQAYYSSLKALPDPQDHNDALENIGEVFKAGLQALKQKKVDAFTHIQHSQRKPLHRSNTMGGSASPRLTDAWAGRDYSPSDGQRAGMHPVRLADGRFAYVLAQ